MLFLSNFRGIFWSNTRRDLKKIKNNILEKFRKVYIKRTTCKNLNGRDIETFLCTNPPLPNSLVQTPTSRMNIFFVFLQQYQRKSVSFPHKIFFQNNLF